MSPASPDVERGEFNKHPRTQYRPNPQIKHQPPPYRYLCCCFPIHIKDRCEKYANRRGIWAFLCWLFWTCLLPFTCSPPQDCADTPPTLVYLPSKSGGMLVPVSALPPNTRPARSARSVRSSRSRSSELGSPVPAATKLCPIPERHESPANIERKPVATEHVAEPVPVVATPPAPAPAQERQMEGTQVHDIEEDPVSAV